MKIKTLDVPYEGRATYSDKLFKFRNGRFEDLLSDDLNQRRGVANKMAGRSVACVDRKVDKPLADQLSIHHNFFSSVRPQCVHRN